VERLPGFRDFYPEPLPDGEAWSADVRQYIFDTWQRVAGCYAFQPYDGPPLETLDLYTAKSGQEIVGQLYNFEDKGERAVSLRPEMTPTVARMIAARERHYKKPIKWYSFPQVFRYERQQKGRLREHFQFNADIFGDTDPATDAELIALLIDVLRAFNLTTDDFVIRLSSRNAWQDFFNERCSDESKAYDFIRPSISWSALIQARAIKNSSLSDSHSSKCGSLLILANPLGSCKRCSIISPLVALVIT